MILSLYLTEGTNETMSCQSQRSVHHRCVTGQSHVDGRTHDRIMRHHHPPLRPTITVPHTELPHVPQHTVNEMRWLWDMVWKHLQSPDIDPSLNQFLFLVVDMLRSETPPDIIPSAHDIRTLWSWLISAYHVPHATNTGTVTSMKPGIEVRRLFEMASPDVRQWMLAHVQEWSHREDPLAELFGDLPSEDDSIYATIYGLIGWVAPHDVIPILQRYLYQRTRFDTRTQRTVIQTIGSWLTHPDPTIRAWSRTTLHHIITGPSGDLDDRIRFHAVLALIPHDPVTTFTIPACRELIKHVALSDGEPKDVIAALHALTTAGCIGIGWTPEEWTTIMRLCRSKHRKNGVIIPEVIQAIAKTLSSASFLRQHVETHIDLLWEVMGDTNECLSGRRSAAHALRMLATHGAIAPEIYRRIPSIRDNLDTFITDHQILDPLSAMLWERGWHHIVFDLAFRQDLGIPTNRSAVALMLAHGLNSTAAPYVKDIFEQRPHLVDGWTEPPEIIIRCVDTDHSDVVCPLIQRFFPDVADTAIIRGLTNHPSHHDAPLPPAVIPTVIRFLTDHSAVGTYDSVERVKWMVAINNTLCRLWNTDTSIAWQVIEFGLASGHPSILSDMILLSLADGWGRGIDDMILTKGILPIYHTWKERLSHPPDTPSRQILSSLMVALRYERPYGCPNAVHQTIRDIVIDATHRIQPDTPDSIITELAHTIMVGYHSIGWEVSDLLDRLMACNPTATLEGIEQWWTRISSSS